MVAGPEEPEDALEAFRKKREAGVGVHRNFSSELCTLDIACSLEMLEREPRVPRTASALAFWEERKGRQPEQHALAQAALGVPATQVGVERAFSALKFILSDQRPRLSPSTLDDVLLQCHKVCRKKFCNFCVHL